MGSIPLRGCTFDEAVTLIGTMSRVGIGPLRWRRVEKWKPKG